MLHNVDVLLLEAKQPFYAAISPFNTLPGSTP